MDIAKQTRNICNLYEITPQRSKGQNFLIEEKYYDEIIEAAEVSKKDLILEVGPGLGFLTAKLSKSAKKVVAIELDDKLANLLKIATDSQKDSNVTVLNGNVLDLLVDQFSNSQVGTEEEKKGSYKIVANLPYNITSVFLKKFLTQVKNKPESLVLMLQKEVAERICAKTGELSKLAISIQVFADAEIIDLVPAKAFWPAPKVDSAIIKIVLKKTTPFISVSERDFFRLVTVGFSAKRKKLANNLAGGHQLTTGEAVAWLKRAGLNENIRAQDLSIGDWFRLLEVKNI